MHPRCSPRSYSHRLRRRVTGAYSTEQCGCVLGRGTARVMHTSRLFARRAAAQKRPCALIFADLVKACDRVLRAAVLCTSSDPASGDQVRGRWRESGVLETVVNDAITYVRNTGGVLSEAALHLGVLHLLRETGNGSDWMEDTSQRQAWVVDRVASSVPSSST